MSELATSEAHQKTSEEERLREELARSREEVLRLRDLLIARDAELGTLKGRVAQLEAGTARLLAIPALVRSLVPGILWRGLRAVLGRSQPRG